MFENEELLKQRIAKNIVFYREQAGDTQLELAEKLNYSDKSISKWERGDGIPGVYTLLCIAECYGITVNDLLAEQPKKLKLRGGRYNHFIVTMLSFGLVWLVATLVYVLLKIIMPTVSAWQSFLYAIPANAIVSIVFTGLWWHRVLRFLSVSALIWSSIICLVTSVPIQNMKLFYVLAAVFQALVILWFMLRKKK